MSDLRPRSARVQAVRKRRRLVTIAAMVGGAVLVIVGATAGIVAFASAQNGAGAVPSTHSAPTPSSTTPAVTPSPTPTPGPSVPAPTASPTPSPTSSGFNRAANSTTDPNSPWVIVNKSHPIVDGANFVPALASIPGGIPNPNGHRLHPFAVEALVKMSDAAKAETGETLIAQSGYRSYSSQVSAFEYWVRDRGSVEEAEKTSARPGFSEHQTGFALDICGRQSGGCVLDGPEFGDSAAGRWLAANSWRFGFILRYPADKIGVTGYEYEPWHFRFVGVELSTRMHDEGVSTLEEFFGVPGSTTYQ